MEILEDNIGGNLDDLGYSDVFLDVEWYVFRYNTKGAIRERNDW